MDLAKKIDVASTAILSISRHDDEEAAIRLEALARVEAFIEAERGEIHERVAARSKQILGAKPVEAKPTEG